MNSKNFTELALQAHSATFSNQDLHSLVQLPSYRTCVPRLRISDQISKSNALSQYQTLNFSTTPEETSKPRIELATTLGSRHNHNNNNEALSHITSHQKKADWNQPEPTNWGHRQTDGLTWISQWRRCHWFRVPHYLELPALQVRMSSVSHCPSDNDEERTLTKVRRPMQRPTLQPKVGSHRLYDSPKPKNSSNEAMIQAPHEDSGPSSEERARGWGWGIMMRGTTVVRGNDASKITWEKRLMLPLRNLLHPASSSICLLIVHTHLIYTTHKNLGTCHIHAFM